MSKDRELEKTKSEIAKLDETAKQIITYSQDDRCKADDLYSFYQTLIAQGDTKDATRLSLAKSLELREMSVGNLIEVLKLKTRLMEKQLLYEIKRQDIEHGNMSIGKRNGGYDTTNIIMSIDEEAKAE